jgi:uncharacterized metal-binding protein YceD (DUF177 family)
MDEFDIPIHGLKEGEYSYVFKIDTGFFEYFNNPDLIGGDLNLDLALVKKPQFFEFTFNFKGFVKVICDRCLEEFDFEIKLTEKLFVRYGSTYEELDDNIIIIPREESRFNIAQYIYEFTYLSIPYKKIHPDTKTGETGCNPEMIKKLHELRVKEDKQLKDNFDPRWDKLKNLN